MLVFALYTAVLLSYGLLLATARLVRAPALSPLSALIFFYFVEYGPHALYRPWLRLSARVPPHVERRYVLAIILTNFVLAMAIFLGRLAMLRGTPGVEGGPAALRKWLIGNRTTAWLFVLLALAYALSFAALDALGPPRLATILGYLGGDHTHSYAAIRRELFAGTRVEAVMNYTRQSSSILILLLLVCCMARYPNLRLFAGAAAAAVFVTAMMQLNKFPLVYAVLGAAIVVHVLRGGRYSLSLRHVLTLAAAAALFFCGLYLLYRLQYREALNRGILTPSALWQLALYRTGLAQADGLRLWFSEFPDRTPFLGLANVALIAGAFDIGYVDVTRLIPAAYLHTDGTTFQAGFIGSGYASFGYLGIALHAFLAGMIGVFGTALTWRIRWPDLRASYCAALSLNMFFLCSREFGTALLSGGILPLLLFGMLASAGGRRRSRRTARCVCPDRIPAGTCAASRSTAVQEPRITARDSRGTSPRSAALPLRWRSPAHSRCREPAR